MENTVTIQSVESMQRDWATIAVTQSKSLVVNTQQDYDNASELCKDIKNRINQIKYYWKDTKDNAYKAWKNLCAKEQELLDPFTKAETELKGKMADFQRKKLEEERLLREEQERWKREEAERLLKEAEQAEADGMAEHSEYLVEMAEQTQNMQFKEPPKVKTADTSRKIVWKARVINPSIVPAELNGVIIRPIDTKALDKMAQLSKGNTKVPGVEFYEDIQIAVRTR